MLLALIFISANSRLYASHIAGAEITYKHISGNKYLFTLKVYRDCNSCKFNNNGGGDNQQNCNEVPDLKIMGANGSSYSQLSLGQIDVTRTIIKDLTPVCYSSKSKCTQGSNLNIGYEVHEFEGVYDFTSLLNQNKCDFEISIDVSSRNLAINPTYTEQKFYNYCHLNICNNNQNTSTKFKLDPVFLLFENQTNSVSLGIENTDGDSLSFKLKPALVNRNQQVTYESARNYEFPFSIKCPGPAGTNINCSPNLSKDPVEGFYFNSLSGDIQFTPIINNQGGVIVIECEEWKKDINGKIYLAGLTRRDVFSEVVNFNNNLPKFINLNQEYNLCQGDEFEFQLLTSDITISGGLPDSVTIDVIGDLNHIDLIRNFSNTAPYNFYTIKLKNNIPAGTHYYTLVAKDNNCPINGISSKTLVITVLPKRKINFTYDIKNCGEITFKGLNPLNNKTKWTLIDANNVTVKSGTGLNFKAILTEGGKYKIQIMSPSDINYCETTFEEIIDVKDFIIPEFDLGSNYQVCKGVKFKISPKYLKTFDDYTVIFNQRIINFPFDTAINTSTEFSFKILQKNGCSVTDKISVGINPSFNYTKKNIDICNNHNFPLSLSEYVTFDQSEFSSISFETTNSNISLTELSAKNTQLEIINKNLATNAILNFILIDKNGCIYEDKITINTLLPEKINIKLPEYICRNVKSFELPLNFNGEWYYTIDNSLIINNLLLNDGNKDFVDLTYKANDVCNQQFNYQISYSDTPTINTNIEQTLTVCENNDNIALVGLPSNGKWYGTNVANNLFIVSSAIGNTSKLSFKYTNNEGCTSIKNHEIVVEEFPVIELILNKTNLCVGEPLVLTSNTTPSCVGYWSTTGNGQINNPNSNNVIYYPDLLDTKQPLITFSYTAQTNGACGNISKQVDVHIKDGPKGEITTPYQTNVCEPFPLKLSTNYTDITKQLWYVNDSLIEEFDYPFDAHISLNAGLYRVKTVVSNDYCVAESTMDNILINPKPKGIIITNPLLKLNREYPRVYIKDNNRNDFTRNWYVDDQWVSDQRDFYHNIQYQKDSVIIKLISKNEITGCVDSTKKLLMFTPINQLYIPDAFSPDSKGPEENNVFTVKGPPMKSYYIMIYNRWGQKLYESNDMTKSWDGTEGGTLCKSDAYFYMIKTTDLEGISRDYSGTVNIIR